MQAKQHASFRATSSTKPTARRNLAWPAPCLFEHAGIRLPSAPPEPFDVGKLIRVAMGIWRVSVPAKHAVLYAKWLDASGLTHVEGIEVRFHPNLSYRDGRAPGLLFLVRDVASNEPCGIQRVFLGDDGHEVGRRALGRTTYGAAIKLSDDTEVLEGLFVAPTIETGLKALNTGLAPVWVADRGSIQLSGVEVTTITDGQGLYTGAR
jgi:hypothetical protein